jgi:cytochrome c-type biogenesis protein
MSWLKRIVLALSAVLVIGVVVALIAAPASGEDEFVDPTGVAANANFLALAFLSFVAGVLSFLSPCTLPILPAYFAFTFQSDRKRIATMTLAFFVGLAFVFSLLGASSSALGSLLNENIFKLTKWAGWLLIIFGIMSILGFGFTGPSFQTNRSATLGGSFFFGATFGLGLTPCVGPILGGLLTVAANQSVARGTSMLFIYAVGLGFPLLLVSTLIGDRPRNSLIWRILRGKGWHVNAPWLTLEFFIDDSPRAGSWRESHLGQILRDRGLALTVPFLTLRLWMRDEEKKLAVTTRRMLHLHSTSIISGLLFLWMGNVMRQGNNIQDVLPDGVVTWLTDVQIHLDVIQDKLLAIFQ